MRTKLIDIGNSRGVRIPKPFREEVGLDNEVDMKVKDGGVFIKPVREKSKSDVIDPRMRAALIKTYGPSYSALAKEWDTPEEDAAWADL